MSDGSEIEKLKKFCELNEDCACYDSFDEFAKCCGKKHGIENPVNTLFKMVEQMSNQSDIPRIRDMEPEQAQKALENIFKILEDI